MNIPYVILISSISFCTIAYEIALMRIFSFILWDQMVGLIISMALLGYGASGSFLFLLWKRIKTDINSWITWASILCGFSYPLCYMASKEILPDPMRLIYLPREWLLVSAIYLLLSIPFFLGGFIVGAILSISGKRIHTMYGFDLMGGCAGAVIIFPLMYHLFPWQIITLIGIFLIISVSLFSRLNKNIRAHVICTLCILILIYLISIQKAPQMHPKKDLSIILSSYSAEIEKTQKSPRGLIHVVRSPLLRHYPGVSLKFGIEIKNPSFPKQRGIFVDGTLKSEIIKLDEKRLYPIYLDYVLFRAPFKIRKAENVIIIGAGGGDSLLALKNGAKDIYILEDHPEILKLIKEGYNEFSGRIYENKNIKIIQKNIREFLNSHNRLYDLIFINFTKGHLSNSCEENFIITEEAFLSYLKNLKQKGMICITSWLKFPPRDSIRLLNLSYKALSNLNNVKNPKRNIILIRTWNIFTLIISPSAFSKDELKNIIEFCNSRGFDLVYFPGVKRKLLKQYDILERPYYFEYANYILSSKRSYFIKNYAFNIEVPTDNRPYFSQFIRLNTIGRLYDDIKKDMFPMVEGGYVFATLSFMQSILVGAMLILIPLVFLPKNDASVKISKRYILYVIVYFTSIGAGYLLIETVLISKFTLLLNHSIYSASVVIGSALCFSGIGSIISGYLDLKKRRLILLIPGISVVVWFIIEHIITIFLVDGLLGLSLIIRIIFLIFIMSLLFLFLGMPFPFGIRIIQEKMPHIIPWAFGINGCSSVLGATIGKLISMTWGFEIAFAISCALYLISSIVLFKLSR